MNKTPFAIQKDTSRCVRSFFHIPLSKSLNAQIAPSSDSMTSNSELERLNGLTELMHAYVENVISRSQKGVLCNGKTNSDQH